MVRGAVVKTADGTVTIRAARGVLLATGSSRDTEKRRERFPTWIGSEDWALPPESVSGDGVRLGKRAGERARSPASPIAWCPVSIVPYRNGLAVLSPHHRPRRPGIIGVCRRTSRFVNEADGYHDTSRP
jgi:hypothetical protein